VAPHGANHAISPTAGLRQRGHGAVRYHPGPESTASTLLSNVDLRAVCRDAMPRCSQLLTRGLRYKFGSIIEASATHHTSTPRVMNGSKKRVGPHQPEQMRSAAFLAKPYRRSVRALISLRGCDPTSWSSYPKPPRSERRQGREDAVNGRVRLLFSRRCRTSWPTSWLPGTKPPSPGLKNSQYQPLRVQERWVRHPAG
jgi:hypothetical protein